MKVSKNRVNVFVCVFTNVVATMYAQSSAATSSCGEKMSTRMDENVFGKHRLRSRVVESQPINRVLECHVKCMKNCRCLSYNVCNGGKLCELNSEKKENNISLFEASDDCDYYEYEYTKEVSRNYEVVDIIPMVTFMVVVIIL